MRLSIRLKLLLSFGLLLAMMVALSAISLYEMSEMNEKAEFIEENIIPSMNSASDMRRIVNRYRALQAALLVYTDSTDLANTIEDLAQQEQDMASILAVYPGYIIAEDERVTFNRLSSEWAELVERANNELIPTHQRGDNEGAEQIFTSMRLNFDRIIASSGELRDIVQGQADEALTSVQDAYNTSRNMIFIFSAVLLTVATVLGLVLSSMIARNIGKLAAATSDVAAGNLERKTERLLARV